MSKVKMIESWRSKIKSIFKESVEDLQDEVPADQPIGDVPVDDAGADGGVPEEVESPKVTIEVSLLKSLLDFVKGGDEEGIEDIDIEGGEEGEESPESPEGQLTEEEEVAPEVGGEESPEGLEGLEMEDDEVSVDAIVAKITELGQSEEILTDEHFAQIVGETEEGEEGMEEPVGDIAPEGDVAPEGEEGKIQEKIGDKGPARQTGNNGIGK